MHRCFSVEIFGPSNYAADNYEPIWHKLTKSNFVFRHQYCMIGDSSFYLYFQFDGDADTLHKMLTLFFNNSPRYDFIVLEITKTEITPANQTVEELFNNA